MAKPARFGAPRPESAASPVSPIVRISAVTLGVAAASLLFLRPASPPVPYAASPSPPPMDGAIAAAGDSTALVIDLIDDATPEQVAAVAWALGSPLTLAGPDSADAGLYTAAPPAGQTWLQAMGTVRALGPNLIEAVEPEGLYNVDDVPSGPTAWLGYPNDPGLATQWNLARIGAATGWRAGGGRGVIVAVIDTGVTPSDELLNLLSGKSFVPGTTSAADEHGHGTHVAGTIAQATHNGVWVAGVAPNATILPLKVLSASGSGQTSWIAAAIDHAVDEGAHVINLSLGGGHSDVLVKAVERARAHGVIVVAAAGNTGVEGLGSPADAEHTLAVSALGPDDALAPYSSWGKGVEIAAPGGDKRAAGGGITQAVVKDGRATLSELQGTSMASPHVAGAAAVLLGMGASPEEAERALLTHSDRADDALRFGAGKLDVGAAVRGHLIARRGLLFGVSATIGLAVALLAGMKGWSRVATVLSAGIAGGGMFVLPMLPLPPTALGDLLQRPFQEWPSASWLGVTLAGFPLWQSALVPALLAVFVAPLRGVGPLAVGLGLGVGTYLLYGAATGDVPLWLPMVWGRTWLTVNGTLALLTGLAGAGMVRMRQRSAGGVT
ncbi:MAG: hypothetical protein EXR69_03585 [Myxococcales bacterium]|nr:hypothetical protein [Myxococcales bacterium]